MSTRKTEWTVKLHVRDFLSIWTRAPSDNIYPAEQKLIFREHEVTIRPETSDLETYRGWKIGQKVQCGDIQGTVSFADSAPGYYTLRIIINCEVHHYSTDASFVLEKAQAISQETVMDALREAFPQKTPGKVENAAFSRVKYTGLFKVVHKREVGLNKKQVPEHLQWLRLSKA